jgi:DNA-binding FadR family transcriptional regulator
VSDSNVIVGDAPIRSSLSAQVLESLVRAIVREDYTAGDSFPPESEIAGLFGVSKPTARETLKLLQALGFVDIGHGRRTTVTDITEWDVLSPIVARAFEAEGRGRELAAQYWQLRHIVEANTAYLAATNATEEERIALRNLAVAMERSASMAVDLAVVLRLDHEFHDLVGRASRNLALRRVAVLIHKFHASSSPSRLTADLLNVLVGQHHRVATAIANGDGDEAATAMDAHITWAMGVDSNGEDDSLSMPTRRATPLPPFRSSGL